jgi:hypothetical protein
MFIWCGWNIQLLAIACIWHCCKLTGAVENNWTTRVAIRFQVANARANATCVGVLLYCISYPPPPPPLESHFNPLTNHYTTEKSKRQIRSKNPILFPCGASSNDRKKNVFFLTYSLLIAAYGTVNETELLFAAWGNSNRLFMETIYYHIIFCVHNFSKR